MSNGVVGHGIRVQPRSESSKLPEQFVHSLAVSRSEEDFAGDFCAA
jgi:hypothetical protein